MKRLHTLPGIALVIAVVLATLGIVVVTAQEPVVVVRFINGNIPLNPTAPTWPKPVDVPLTSQTLVYPLPVATESRTVSVAAVYNGTHIAFLLSWSDATEDVPKAGGLDVFPDAAAIQFPVSRAQLPYICMGTVDNPVNIIYWKAGVGVENMVAGAGYGLNPQQREALGLQATPTSPVEPLPAPAQVVQAYATYGGSKWYVILIRPLGSVHPLMTSLAEDFSVAFAVWDGARGERGGLKATSGWVQFRLEKVAAPVATVTQTIAPQPTAVTQTVTTTVTTVVETTPTWAWAVIGVLVALLAVVAGLALRRSSQRS